jgi:hypothetical protein
VFAIFKASSPQVVREDEKEKEKPKTEKLNVNEED